MISSKPVGSTDFRIEDCHGNVGAACQSSTWESDISSGVPAMDRLHHKVFTSLDVLSSSDDEHFCEEFTAFVGTVERAFREEEAWMDDVDFSAIATHQEQHARVLSALHHVHSVVMDGDIALGRHVADELLPQWLMFHISTMDTPFALAMQLAHSERDLSLQPS
jgi:hemerythrin